MFPARNWKYVRCAHEDKWEAHRNGVNNRANQASLHRQGHRGFHSGNEPLDRVDSAQGADARGHAGAAVRGEDGDLLGLGLDGMWGPGSEQGVAAVQYGAGSQVQVGDVKRAGSA